MSVLAILYGMSCRSKDVSALKLHEHDTIGISTLSHGTTAASVSLEDSPATTSAHSQGAVGCADRHCMLSSSLSSPSCPKASA